MKNSTPIRLHKAIADAGLASRRKAETWILEGRVTVNGKKITELGAKADPTRDRILVNGKPIPKKNSFAYYAFFKPENIMVTANDPEGRPTIYDLLPKIRERVYPAGRLDFDSEGLLLLTNDGDLTHKLTHPRSKTAKTYNVKIAGVPNGEALVHLRRGIKLNDGITAPAEARIIKKGARNCWLEMQITEGKNRQVRRMMEAVGHPVIRLVRVAIGPLKLGTLKSGNFRKLDEKEIAQLKKIV